MAAPCWFADIGAVQALGTSAEPCTFSVSEMRAMFESILQPAQRLYGLDRMMGDYDAIVAIRSCEMLTAYITSLDANADSENFRECKRTLREMLIGRMDLAENVAFPPTMQRDALHGSMSYGDCRERAECTLLSCALWLTFGGEATTMDAVVALPRDEVGSSRQL